jgi:hypothetical protein
VDLPDECANPCDAFSIDYTSARIHRSFQKRFGPLRSPEGIIRSTLDCGERCLSQGPGVRVKNSTRLVGFRDKRTCERDIAR